MGVWANIAGIFTKANPAQESIVLDQGTEHTTTINEFTLGRAYYKIEAVNRGTSLIVDAAAAIPIDIKGRLKITPIHPKTTEGKFTKQRLHTILNVRPNPYQDIDQFKRLLYTDLVVEGNAFLYFDGMSLYILPASNVKVVADKKAFVSYYEYDNTKFNTEDIIHIKDNSAKSIFRGDSRLLSALNSINLIESMMSYQKNFFDNSAIPGLVLKTPNTLSTKVKDRLLKEWSQKYNPRLGGKRPMILDGDFSLDSLGHTDNRELDFNESFQAHERRILKALGVPPILLDSGNNANVSPNVKLFYLNTVLPLVTKVISALEYYFAYDLKMVTQDVLALRPELKDEGAYYTSLVNSGIVTINEVRDKLRYPTSEEEHASKLRIPANIAGSALDSNQGGKPPKEPQA